MSPSFIGYYAHPFIVPVDFAPLEARMKLGDSLLASRPPRVCKVCGSPDKSDFAIPDDTRRTVVPTEYQNQVVCVDCFGKFACEKQVELFRVQKIL